MKSLKLTLESFKEIELLRTHKLKINGGLPVDGLPPEELPLEFDEDGDPIYNAGPGPKGGGGPSSGVSAASLGNPGGNILPPIGGSKK